jgi:hypothetical protein
MFAEHGIDDAFEYFALGIARTRKFYENIRPMLSEQAILLRQIERKIFIEIEPRLVRPKASQPEREAMR